MTKRLAMERVKISANELFLVLSAAVAQIGLWFLAHS